MRGRHRPVRPPVDPTVAPLWRPGDDVSSLAEILDRGGVLAIPTESSYGLAADPASARGVETIFRLKGRAADQPLPVVAADRAALAGLGIDADSAEVDWLWRRWPAPLTGVLPTQAELPASCGLGTLAVRVPAHPLLRRLLQELGRPLTATSANRSGQPPILNPQPLRVWLARFDGAVVDGGILAGGDPSTIVGFDGGAVQILRRGAGVDELAAALPPQRDPTIGS